MYDAHTSQWKQDKAVTALAPFKHLLQVASYLKLYCVSTFSLNNDSEIQFICVQLNAETCISCEDFRKCRRHRWLYSACHSSLELKRWINNKKDILNCSFDFSLLLHPSVFLSNQTLTGNSLSFMQTKGALRNGDFNGTEFELKTQTSSSKAEFTTEFVGFSFYLTLF